MRNKSLVLLIVLLLVATLSLTSCLEVDTFTVTFNSDGGTSVSSQTVTDGNTATEPVSPTKDGYTFLGWFAEGSDTAFDFSTAITASITLTAQWQADEVTEPEVETFTVTFDAQNGETATGVSMDKGATIVAPETDPTKEATAQFTFAFASWNTAVDGTGDDFVADSTVTTDITYYAQYTETTRTYTVTITAGDNVVSMLLLSRVYHTAVLSQLVTILSPLAKLQLQLQLARLQQLAHTHLAVGV